MKRLVVVSVLLAIFLNYSEAYRILCPYPTTSRSHFIVANALFKGLAAKGHDVTVISPYPPEKTIPNYRHITIQMQSNHDEIMKSFTDNPGEVVISIDLIGILLNITLVESHGMLVNPQVQTIMTEEQFDLVIMEFLGEPHIGLSAHFNCPVVLFSSVKPTYRLLEIMGNPLALSYIKNPLLSFDSLDTFTDRLLNFITYLVEKSVVLYCASKYNTFHNEHFPPSKYPAYPEIINNNVAAVFVTHHFSQGEIRPLVPGIIEISGIQMTEIVTPLPDALQTWMDQSINGVIYFSLGSNLKVSKLAPKTLETIISAFTQLKLNVLWKCDVPTMDGLPSNVRLEQWVSQVDVLQHKNIKLFITHGGFGSITESKFYGVPVLVVPIFGDQMPNANAVTKEGWGTTLPYAELTHDRLLISINELINNIKYSNQAKYESMLYRDRPQSPLQTGIFWIEYIIRHKGARHMRSNATQLNWFQLHSLDVIGFLFVVFMLWAYLSFRILKIIVKKIFGPKKSKLKLN